MEQVFNFSIFGTLHLPRRVPRRYGIDERMPAGYVGQLVQPFRRSGGGRGEVEVSGQNLRLEAAATLEDREKMKDGATS